MNFILSIKHDFKIEHKDFFFVNLNLYHILVCCGCFWNYWSTFLCTLQPWWSLSLQTVYCAMHGSDFEIPILKALFIPRLIWWSLGAKFVSSPVRSWKRRHQNAFLSQEAIQIGWLWSIRENKTKSGTNLTPSWFLLILRHCSLYSRLTPQEHYAVNVT